MVKRLFDVFLALLIVILFFWILIIVWLVAIMDTKTNGVFIQERIGQFGEKFNIYKFRTIKCSAILDDRPISKFGSFLRKYKLDELPQLFNILNGDMSFVGPRPDLPGYYNLLEGEFKKILELKPGLTSLASLKYRYEEIILANQKTPLIYNDTVIFPDKVKLNLEYYYNHNLRQDILIIFNTFYLTFLKRHKNG